MTSNRFAAAAASRSLVGLSGLASEPLGAAVKKEPGSGPRAGLLVMRDGRGGFGRAEDVGEDVDAGVDAVLQAVVEPGLEQTFLRGDDFTGACGDRAEQFECRRAQLGRLDGAVDEALGGELADRVEVSGEDDFFGFGQADVLVQQCRLDTEGMPSLTSGSPKRTLG